MANGWIIPLSIVIATTAGMEVVATLVHRHVMHGRGWAWHRSHHQPGSGRFERNDLYGLLFAALSTVLFVGGARRPALWWIGLGMAVYGLLYALLHDGIVHRRFGFVCPPRGVYLKRLIQAHRLHHAVHGRTGAVSYGFLYAPPLQRLLDRMRGDENPQ